MNKKYLNINKNYLNILFIYKKIYEYKLTIKMTDIILLKK
jgi:hypothetical protein